ncbi:MAG: KEOPS complex subunit Pcc1 [Candidatus Bathyarchaeota archaeon]|nr:KEOPS complex subunit Pcc1 [Candidatus Bathyarchaeota archaeon]
MKAVITLKYKTERDARAVAEAVSPDNAKTPAGLSVKTFGKGKTVTTLIECSGRLETLLSTLDDLLSCTQVAEKAVKILKNEKG